MTDDHSAFVGKWRQVKCEHLEEFLIAYGANWLIRKLMSKSNPDVEITINGDEIKIRLITMLISLEDIFTVGTPFEQKQPDGNVSLASARWEDGKLIVEFKPKVEGRGKPQTVTREVVDGQLVMSFKVDDVVMTRWYNKAT